MSVRDQLNFPEERRITLTQRGGGAPWLTDPLAEANAICVYNTAGTVTVTVQPFYIADTLATPLALQVNNLPDMKYSEENLDPAIPNITLVQTPVIAIVNSVYQQICLISIHDENDDGRLVMYFLGDPYLGTDFIANSEIIIPSFTLTYRWASLPEHGGI